MEKVHVLGFDASDGFHEYGIVWGSDAIEWRVDGNLVRRLCFCTLRCGMQVGLMKGSGVGSTVGVMSLMFVSTGTFVFPLELLLWIEYSPLFYR